MKKVSNFLILGVSLVISVSCGKSQVSDLENIDKTKLITDIASDEAFENYMYYFSLHTKAIASKEYDLKKIGEFIDSKKASISLCSMEDDLLKDIHGGISYKYNSCKMSEALNRLTKKFPTLNSLPKEDFTRLIELYGTTPLGSEQKKGVINSILENH